LSYLGRYEANRVPPACFSCSRSPFVVAALIFSLFKLFHCKSDLLQQYSKIDTLTTRYAHVPSQGPTYLPSARQNVSNRSRGPWVQRSRECSHAMAAMQPCSHVSHGMTVVPHWKCSASAFALRRVQTRSSLVATHLLSKQPVRESPTTYLPSHPKSEFRREREVLLLCTPPPLGLVLFHAACYKEILRSVHPAPDDPTRLRRVQGKSFPPTSSDVIISR